MIKMPEHSEVVLRYVFERYAKETPDRVCVDFEGGEAYTWKEALKAAYTSTNVLASYGIKRDDNVLVFLPNGKDFILSWWGLNFQGSVMVPINPAYKGEMLRHICTDSLAKHVITTSDFAERIKELGLDLNIIDPAKLTDGSPDEPKLDSPLHLGDTFAIMYTSGTTGPSKGVMNTYMQNWATLHGAWKDMNADDTMLVTNPLFHIGGISSALPAWMVGGKAAVRAKFSATNFLDIVRESGSTFVVFVGTIPAYLEATPPQPNDSDNPLRVVGCSPMVKDPVAFKARYGIERLEVQFGQTEMNNPFINYAPEINPTSCGKLTGLYDVQLVDENDIPVPPGHAGELVCRPLLPWLTNAGYWRNPEATAKAWRNGWWHTGDHFVLKDGEYYFADRKTDSLRRRGENVSSFEVEREVWAYPGITDVACIGVPDGYGGHEVKICIVVKDKANFDPVDLTNFLIPRMPYYMIPRYIEVLDELPKTPTMRVQKYELRDRGNGQTTWDREAAGIKITRAG